MIDHLVWSKVVASCTDCNSVIRDWGHTPCIHIVTMLISKACIKMLWIVSVMFKCNLISCMVIPDGMAAFGLWVGTTFYLLVVYQQTFYLLVVYQQASSHACFTCINMSSTWKNLRKSQLCHYQLPRMQALFYDVKDINDH